MKKLLLFVLLSTGFVPLFAQDSTSVSTTEISMITNRPGASESSRAVFKKGFQIETGLEFGKVPNFKGNPEGIEYLFLPSFGFQYGVSENVELRIFATNYATRSINNGAPSQFVYNLSNVTAGAKINILKSKGIVPEMALLLTQGIPTNPADVRKQWPTTALLAWSYSLPANFGLAGNLGYINQKEVFEQQITFDHSWSYTLNVGYSIQENTGVFVEIFGTDNMNDNTTVPVNFDGGFWYRFNPKFQVDVSAGYGFDVGSSYVNAGLSWLFLN